MRTVNGELWIFEQQEHQAKLSHLSNSSLRWKSFKNWDLMYVWDSKQPIFKWMFGYTTISHVKIWKNHETSNCPIERTISFFGWDSRWGFIHRCIPYTSKKSSHIQHHPAPRNDDGPCLWLVTLGCNCLQSFGYRGGFLNEWWMTSPDISAILDKVAHLSDLCVSINTYIIIQITQITQGPTRARSPFFHTYWKW